MYKSASVVLFSKWQHRFFGAGLLALICGSGFVGISLFNVSRQSLIHLPAIQALRWDASIPFVPGWIWIYLFYYPFCFLPLLLANVRNDAVTFTRTVAAFSFQFAISFAFFLIIPLRMIHPLLPAGLEGQILKSLYGFDLGFNSFPSLHVANIVFVSLLFLRQRGRWWGGLVVAGALLIAASTMLVKQHFIADVLVGALLGWASFAMSERFIRYAIAAQPLSKPLEDDVPGFSRQISR